MITSSVTILKSEKCPGCLCRPAHAPASDVKKRVCVLYKRKGRKRIRGASPSVLPAYAGRNRKVDAQRGAGRTGAARYPSVSCVSATEGRCPDSWRAKKTSRLVRKTYNNSVLTKRKLRQIACVLFLTRRRVVLCYIRWACLPHESARAKNDYT